jgi:hypothetical protein
MPFPKGVSGNPAGRTREQRATERELSACIRGLVGEDGKQLVERLLEFALQAEPPHAIKAIVVLLERGFGKVTDVLHVDGNISPAAQAAIEALRFTPLERRRAIDANAQDTTEPSDG